MNVIPFVLMRLMVLMMCLKLAFLWDSHKSKMMITKDNNIRTGEPMVYA